MEDKERIIKCLRNIADQYESMTLAEFRNEFKNRPIDVPFPRQDYDEFRMIIGQIYGMLAEYDKDDALPANLPYEAKEKFVVMRFGFPPETFKIDEVSSTITSFWKLALGYGIHSFPEKRLMDLWDYYFKQSTDGMRIKRYPSNRVEALRILCDELDRDKHVLGMDASTIFKRIK